MGGELVEELTKLRRYIIDMAASIDEKTSMEASELADRLFVLNYLIEDVGYFWDCENKHQL